MLTERQSNLTLMAVLAEASGASYTAGVISPSSVSCAFRMPSTSRPSGLKALLGAVMWYCKDGFSTCELVKQCSPFTCTEKM